jgi:uracil-DNA glycosylase
MKLDNKLKNTWKKLLSKEMLKPYFLELSLFLEEEKKSFEIYPPEDQVFAAFNLCSFENTKVVIIGQDPYHGKGQANGLSFSVSEGIKIPPSLQNIFKELSNDLACDIPKTGNLESWAMQGVLLLNATLTVREKEAASHQKKGWELFTDNIIELLSEQKENLVFLLWGNFAQSKEVLIDSKKHLILKAAHPSPLARGAFFGCKAFSKTNDFLKKNKIEEIKWEIKALDLFSEMSY